MPELHLQRSGSTLDVILGERRLSFPLIDVALNATYAGYLGHPFTKSETCAGTISLVSHLVFTKRCMEQENREEAHPCFLNRMRLFRQPGKEWARSLCLRKENRAGKTETRRALDMATTGRRASFTHPS